MIEIEKDIPDTPITTKDGESLVIRVHKLRDALDGSQSYQVALETPAGARLVTTIKRSLLLAQAEVLHLKGTYHIERERGITLAEHQRLTCALQRYPLAGGVTRQNILPMLRIIGHTTANYVEQNRIEPILGSQQIINTLCRHLKLNSKDVPLYDVALRMMGVRKDFIMDFSGLGSAEMRDPNYVDAYRIIHSIVKRDLK